MTLLIDWIVRPSVVLALAFAMIALLRSRAAALRHCILAVAILVAGISGPLSAIVPEWTITVPQRSDATRADAVSTAALSTIASTEQRPQPTAEFDMTRPLVALWLCGIVLCLARIAVSLIGLRRVAARADVVKEPRWHAALADVAGRLDIARPIRLLESGSRHDLATWGIRRPYIVVPARASSWSEAWIRALLYHELEHVRRGDWLLNVVTDAVQAVHWFNPLFWYAGRRLRLESERACDDAVLRAGATASEYASQLVAIARRRPSTALLTAAVPISRPSTLQRRIAAMLNPRLAHESISRRAAALVVLGLVGIALPIVAVQARQAGPRALQGVVYDATGAVVADAAVSLQPASGAARKVATDGDGHFTFADVPAGQYTLEVEVAGFARLSQQLTLARERDWTRAVTLQVGTVQEEIVVTERRPDQPTASNAVTSPTRARVGGLIKPPTKRKDVRPIYPPALRDAGVEGVVPLEATIGLDGTVQHIRVISAQVHPDLAKAAMTAVRQWQFTPTLLNGQPTEVVMTVTVAFQLEQK